MKDLRAFLFLLLACATVQAGRPPSPFGVKASLATNDGATVVRFQFKVPPEHVIYAERLHFENTNGDELTPSKIPTPVTAPDKVTGREKRMFNQPFVAELKLEAPLPLDLIVKFQGCSNAACFFPEKRRFSVSNQGVVAVISAPGSAPDDAARDARGSDSDWGSEVEHFKMAGKRTGYVKADDFVSFLNRAAAGDAAGEEDTLGHFRNLSPLATIGLIALGGAGLNLTPCVLPLIPINLAIIMGAAGGRSRRRGFSLGTTYAAGIALAYGVLGLVVVVTGAKFGTLNSSPWFNVLIAAVFVALALGMFDLLHIDFTKFQSSVDTTHLSRKGQFPFAFGLGVMTALLAGACVAPVVISVLLLAGNMYMEGQVVGLLLPFVLGVGMASPWPFAGAGLAYIPKPGKWMTWVKYGFGVLILIFAGYYGHLAYGLFQSQRAHTSLAAAPGTAGAVPDANQSLVALLKQARTEGKAVLIDFQASWCKNCVAMDETVFNQAGVQKHLQEFVMIKYPAEQPNDSPAREVLDHFGVLGLPTYVVLSPIK